MLNGLKQYLFLVVDQETKGILARCSSANVANAVSQGITNSSPMTIYFQFANHNINKYQDDTTLNYKLQRAYVDEIGMDSETNVAEPVKVDRITESFIVSEFVPPEGWISKREIANFRSKRFRDLENICDRYISRVKTFCGDELLYQYLGKELDKVSDNYYPASIIEWADLAELTVDEAYQELRMNYESVGITLMRIHALWRKYVFKVNALNAEEEFLNLGIIKSFDTELKFGARR